MFHHLLIVTIFYKKHPDIDEIKRIPGIKIYNYNKIKVKIVEGILWINQKI